MLRSMWVQNIIGLLDRRGVGEHLPDPRMALRVFSKCSEEVLQLVGLNIVGGYQTQSMKAKWDSSVSDSCPFCGEPDTCEHRLVHCKVGKSVREQFAGDITPSRMNLRTATTTA